MDRGRADRREEEEREGERRGREDLIIREWLSILSELPENISHPFHGIFTVVKYSYDD